MTKKEFIEKIKDIPENANLTFCVNDYDSMVGIDIITIENHDEDYWIQFE